MYELISQNDADKIKDILKNTWLHKNLDFRIGDFLLQASSISETNPTKHHSPFNMFEIYLLNSESEFGVIGFNGKKYDAFMNVGEWGYTTRLKDTHITLGSSKIHDFCFQLELSQSIKDDQNIYLIKNISNLAGSGAICRLYRGLKSDKEAKYRRRDIFVERFGQEIIQYENKDWIVISKINIKDLLNESKDEEIFFDLIYNMFFAMLLIEDIGDK